MVDGEGVPSNSESKLFARSSKLVHILQTLHLSANGANQQNCLTINHNAAFDAPQQIYWQPFDAREFGTLKNKPQTMRSTALQSTTKKLF